jgi:hypothetical protein
MLVLYNCEIFQSGFLNNLIVFSVLLCICMFHSFQMVSLASVGSVDLHIYFLALNFQLEEC